jgi:hypothetical protein
MNIKNTLRLLAAFAFSASAFFAKPIPGPNGGRIVTTAAPHVEFFVAKDRSVVVSFYDKDLKPEPVAAQVVSATAELKSGKVKLDFATKNGTLVSKSPLPAGDDFTVVLQVRANATGKPTNYRIAFHEEVCGDCKRAEYACVCEDAGKEHAHDHGTKKKE